jgi:hypothetical protein
MQHRTLRFDGSLLFAAAALAAAPVLAAEVYLQPIATLTAETDSNLDLDPSVKQEVQGYLLDAATIIGIATQESNTIFRPRIVYRYYPQESADNRLEAYLDLNTSYRTQRSTASLVGSIEHLDQFNAELTSALYNDVNPVQPPPDTGKVTVGATRDSAILDPKYVYNFTPIIGAGVSGQYQVVNYSPAGDTSHVDFDYYQARAFLTWTYSQTSDVSFGGYGSKYEATHFASRATGSGATMDLNTTWTPLLSTKASVIYQHTNIDDVLPTPLNTQNNAWGASVAAIYKTQVDQFRLNAGRSISPSGGGAVFDVDRLQFQYDRIFGPRLSFTGALVGLRTHALTANIAGDDRKYAQTILEAKWKMTPTWFVQGGYQFAWQKYQYDLTSGINNRFYIQIGYQGLGQER